VHMSSPPSVFLLLETRSYSVSDSHRN
jgi:hypothetical protein